MDKLIDKAFLICFCSVIYIFQSKGEFAVVTVLLAVVFASVSLSTEKEMVQAIGYVCFIIVSIAYPPLLYFSPLFVYDVTVKEYKIIGYFLLGIVFLARSGNWIIVALSIASVGLRYRIEKIHALQYENIKLIDQTKMMNINLRHENRNLMDKQDYEVNMAKLSERNRIAREIHDHVGHLLSRTILQVGALSVVSQEEGIKNELKSIQGTLKEGMNSIRSSVHDLHNESIELRTEMQKLVDSFEYCTVEAQIAISEHMDVKVKYAVIAIVKEAFANVMKHSNASRIKLTLREHPMLLQLIIHDNGTAVYSQDSEGIGLYNIRNRVESLNGHFNMFTDKGFKIFITIPL